MNFNLLFLFLFLVIVSGFTIQYASALELPHFFEENTVCANTNSTAIVLNVTDTTDFDFISGRDYLIIASSTFGGDLSSATVDIFLAHNQTKFDGGLKIIEPSNSIDSNCVNPLEDFNKYFFWTVWSPIGSEADEDIVIGVNSTNSASFVGYDDASIAIFEISEQLTENVDWFFNANTTDNALAFNSFNSTNDASIQFTPVNNNDDWLILGTNTIDTASAVVQYETRLFVNGTETDLPEISQEGENPPQEKFVQTFARVLTLANSTQLIEVEAQIDAIIAGNHTREYSAIFALNLDKFTDHSFVWSPAVLDVFHVGLFPTLVDSISITPSSNNTDTFILADIGARQIEEQIHLRLQVDNVDEPTGQTAQEYRFLDEWDPSDDLRWTQATLQNLTNVTHTIDVDGGEPTNSGAKAVYRTLVAFTMTLQDIIMNQQDSFSITDSNTFVADITRNQIDNINFTDTNFINQTLSRNQIDNINFTDTNFINQTLSRNPIDNINFTDSNTFVAVLSRNQIDNINFTDTNFINQTLSRNQIDNMNFTDINTFIAVHSRNQTDSIDFIDTNFINQTLSRNQTDNIFFTDSNTFIVSVIKNQIDNMNFTDTNFINQTLSRNQTDNIFFTDSNFINQTLSRNQIDNMNFTDSNTFVAVLSRNQTDSIDFTDSNTFVADLKRNQTDNMNFTDINTFIAVLSRNQTDNMFFTDSNTFIVDIISPVFDEMNLSVSLTQFHNDTIIVIIPPIVVTGGGAGGQGGVSAPAIPDSDQDGIPDDSDQCPLEPETFNQFQDEDGCPDSLDRPEPITIADLGFPFEFNELSVIDDFINLETDSPQSQVEDLGIRWLGDEPITITSIQFASSPFEFQTQDIPVTFGNSQFGFSQMQLIYTIQEPDKICGDVFSFDCIDDITYEIPVTVTAEVRGKIVMSTGSITVDNSNRFNPFWLVGIFLVATPISAFFVLRARSINSNPTAKTRLKVTQAPANKKVTLKTAKPLKAGTTRKLLTESSKTNVLGKKTK